MKKTLLSATLISLTGCANPPMEHSLSYDPLTNLPFTLEVTSSTLESDLVMPEMTVFDGFGCSGGNVSPALTWDAGPEGTKSYLVMLYDPDAPTGVGFHHWWVANLEPTTQSLPEGFGTLPVSDLPETVVQGRTDYGGTSYGGPCPPVGRTHRYMFYVWALGVDALPVETETSAAVVRFMLANEALAVGRLVATYSRQDS